MKQAAATASAEVSMYLPLQMSTMPIHHTIHMPSTIERLGVGQGDMWDFESLFGELASCVKGGSRRRAELLNKERVRELVDLRRYVGALVPRGILHWCASDSTYVARL